MLYLAFKIITSKGRADHNEKIIKTYLQWVFSFNLLIQKEYYSDSQ